MVEWAWRPQRVPAANPYGTTRTVLTIQLPLQGRSDQPRAEQRR